MTLLEELKNRRKISSKIHLKNVEETLAKMYMWVMEQDKLEKHIDRLLIVVDSIESPKDSYQTPGIASLEEQAAAGLELLGCCRSNIRGKSLFRTRGIWDCLDQYGLIDYQNIRYDHVMSKIRDSYLFPFWDYLIEKVERDNDNYTSESKLEYRVSYIFQDDFRKVFPATFDVIQLVNESLNHEQNTWNGVANGCRDILSEFGKELYQKTPDKFIEVKKGDSKGIIRITLTEGKLRSRYNDSLIDLFESTWNHVSSGLHRPKLTKEEVVRMFIWVILLVSEIASLKA